MQPWKHAQSSARRRGGDWREDLEVHEFIDLAKTACVDLRHRVVLHNSDLGPALAEMAFPARADCGDVVRQHVSEDLGCVPSLDDWFETARSPLSAPPRQPDLDRLVDAATEKVRLEDPGPVKEVLNLLFLPERFSRAYSEFARALLMNSFGPVLVRRVLGPARAIPRIDGPEVIFDPSWVAEGLIVAHFGRIPILGETLSPFSGRLKA